MDILRKKEGFKNEKLLVLPGDIVNTASKHPLVKNLYITDVGFFPHAQYHYIERKEGSEQNLLIYCTNGEGFVIINGKKYKVLKNSLLIIPKYASHIYGTDANNPWDIYWVHFKGEVDQFYSAESLTLIDIPLATLSPLTNLFNNILDSLTRGYTINNIIFACQCLNYMLASLFFMPYNKYEHKDKHVQYIESSINYMEKNIDKPVSLEELSSFNNLSKSQLTEVFKEKTGYSPIDFFIRLKIQKACSQLDLSDLTVAEVSSNVGYSDQYYFSRIFKKIMGMSPSDYRKIKKG